MTVTGDGVGVRIGGVEGWDGYLVCWLGRGTVACVAVVTGVLHYRTARQWHLYDFF